MLRSLSCTLRSNLCLVISALVAAVVLVHPRRALAEDNQALELKWQSPPNCPTQSEITEQIRTILGASPGATLPTGLQATGTIEAIEDRFQLTLTVHLGTKVRSRIIAADDCRSLGKAAAVVLGLLIRRANESGGTLSDSDLGGAFGPATGSEEPGHEKATPAPILTTPPPAPAPAPAPRQWQLLVMVPALTADYRLLPKLGYGIGVAAGIAHHRWRGTIAATYFTTQNESRGGVEPYEATFSRKSLEVWGCRGWRAGSLELAPCALAALDVVSASASGDRFTTKPQTIPIVSAGGGLLGLWHLSRPVRLFLSTTGRIVVNRTDFLATGMIGVSTAHIVPWGTIASSFGAELVF